MSVRDQSIGILKGIGERRKVLYEKLGIRTLDDLLSYYPRSYVQFADVTPLSSAPFDKEVCIEATILKKGKEQYIRKNLSVFRIQALSSDQLPLTLKMCIRDSIRCAPKWSAN